MLSIHFDKNFVVPGSAFWSITVYGTDNFKPGSSLNCLKIGEKDELMYNKDGSMDIFIQTDNPGKDKQNNWLMPPAGQFFLVMRLFWPDESGKIKITNFSKKHSDLM